MFENLHVWAASATVVALQILAIYFTPLARLLDLTRVTRIDLALLAICLALPIAIVEVQKMFVRRSARPRS
jgi:small-conductance mechanosensitive channel